MIQVCILNLMPTKKETERQFKSLFKNAGARAKITWLRTASYKSKSTPAAYLQSKYLTFENIKKRKFDIFIITGAPVENMAFEEVKYWRELAQILGWTQKNSLFNIFICWAAQAALYKFYGIKKYKLAKKYSGVFKQEIQNSRSVFYKDFESGFSMPHSRHTALKKADILKNKKLVLELACGREISVVSGKDKKNLYITGHPEYAAGTLHKEYLRDLKAGLKPAVPDGYYPQNNPRLRPRNVWRKEAVKFYKNIINHVLELKGE
ncbi:MAG: homoserine O-succinyltransferase [Elusimicrobiota bacterium]|jgi:homoserine O-succinyltransferase|nr:homoserine O-succinyltransferase [Elusimicrobiota bacterium]